jgi:hypothetical protein
LLRVASDDALRETFFEAVFGGRSVEPRIRVVTDVGRPSVCVNIGWWMAIVSTIDGDFVTSAFFERFERIIQFRLEIAAAPRAALV